MDELILYVDRSGHAVNNGSVVSERASGWTAALLLGFRRLLLTADLICSRRTPPSPPGLAAADIRYVHFRPSLKADRDQPTTAFSEYSSMYPVEPVARARGGLMTHVNNSREQAVGKV